MSGSLFQENARLGDRLCGTDIPSPRNIISTKDIMIVHFLSDSTVAGNGFRLEWRIQGCGGLLSRVSILERFCISMQIFGLAIDVQYKYISLISIFHRTLGI